MHIYRNVLENFVTVYMFVLDYFSDVRIVFFSFRIESNIGLLFEISNRIKYLLPFSKVGMLNSFFS